MSGLTANKLFLKDFIEEIEEKALKIGFIEEPFLNEMLQYMDRPQDPVLIGYLNERLKIQVDAYAFDEDEGTLDLYLVHYDYEQNEDEMLKISMTQLNELANKVKRFVTNAIDLPIEPSREAYGLAQLFNNNISSIEQINIFLLTNLIYQSNKPVDINIPKVSEVNVQVWDIDRVFQLVNAEQGVADVYINFEEQFGQSFELMFVPDPKANQVKDNFDCYIGFIPAELLARAYDRWGPKLVERNVRSFLQARAGTNKGIRDTLKDPSEKQMFVAYNNGISSVARSGEIQQVHEGVNLYRINGLTGWQIVNGGQTTASIHQAYRSGIDLSDVYVQAKLTILQLQEQEHKDLHATEDDMISKISKYANTQNKINQSDLLANTRFMSGLEQHSRNSWVPAIDGRKPDKKWYFERARGQYMVDIGRRSRGKEQNEFKKMYPKEFVLTKVDLAKMFMSWEKYPHVASKGGEAAFKSFMDLNKEYWKYEKDENNNTIQLKELTTEAYQEFIARILINNKVRSIVEAQQLKGYKANVIYYTTSMLNLLYGDQIELQAVWENQNLSEKWDSIIDTIARETLEFLKQSAGDQNVTQWAKKEACWVLFKEECSKRLKNLV
jgi:AIPR protein